MTGYALDAALRETPVIAIIRGVRPEEALAIGAAIVDAGVRVIEVPLNSPSPFDSIRILAGALRSKAVIGAGTVLREAEVDSVAEAGGAIIVAPNCNPAVVRRSLEKGLLPFPGVMTPTEMFSAIDAGARNLKLFPAAPLGTGALSALSAVTPEGVSIFAVGGVGVKNAREWLKAGAAGLGVGSDIFRPGDAPETVHKKTKALIAAIRP